MPILVGTPVAPPVVVLQADWHGMGVSWAAKGKTFDLTDLSSGIVLSQGVRGLGMPTVTAYTDDSPALAGARFRGSQVGPRSVFWPIFIWSDFSSQEWVDRDDAFWSTMDPDVPGLWTITRPNGKKRSLLCQFTDDGSWQPNVDPIKFGWGLYGVTLTAYDEPYWQEDPITRTFLAPSSSPFFLSSGGVFFISPGGTTDTATIPNPGDVPAWPIWTLNGPVSGASLGAGGGVVTVPFSLTSGQSLVVDTRPSEMTAIDGTGADRSGDVVWAPQPVPAGGQVALAVSMSSPGTGASLTCSLTPRFRRAW